MIWQVQNEKYSIYFDMPLGKEIIFAVTVQNYTIKLQVHMEGWSEPLQLALPHNEPTWQTCFLRNLMKKTAKTWSLREHALKQMYVYSM